MEDVQQREDHRGVALDKAGVTGLRYPIVVLDRTFTKQHTVATITMSVSVPQQFKGTHMSRFIEVLEEHRDDVNMWALPTIIGALRQRLDAESARIEMTFPYFLERAAPVTGSTGLMDYACTFIGESSQNG
ncbi:MAG: GTP cyclohydrolase, FolE2/MptA family, partial [Myxococcota bacterium]